MSELRKAPFKVLFSNDTTNILSCVSPYHGKDQAFRPEMLEASIDETALTGIQVHLFQPGVGVVPWWKSRQYSYENHAKWFKQTYGVGPDDNPYAPYMLDGGDMVEVFVNRCRRKGLIPFVSLRLNDSHGKEYADGFVGNGIPEIPGFAYHCLNRFYKDHPEYRIGSDITDWDTRVLNWAHPEVRQWMFGFVRELCEQYDIDGLELDFMRHPGFFRPKETPKQKRVEIMTTFVKDVRAVLDRTAKSGKHRWLCVRVPCHPADHDALGIHLRSFADAGVDMVNLSPYYYTVQQTDMAAVKKMLPDVSVYLEMCHCTRERNVSTNESSYDSFLFRRTTPTQYFTAAHLAYSRELEGVSTFNFVYYREHGVGERGPFNEPPFQVFQHLGDPAWLARQPQHYILSDAYVGGPPLPRTLTTGQSADFRLDMAPPEGGWKKGGRLRIQAEADLSDSRWEAFLNGVKIEETYDRSEPYDNPYPPLLGTVGHHRAWIVPSSTLKDGMNVVKVTMTAGSSAAKLVFLDLALE